MPKWKDYSIDNTDSKFFRFRFVSQVVVFIALLFEQRHISDRYRFKVPFERSHFSGKTTCDKFFLV